MSSTSSPNKLKMECSFCHLPINFLEISTKGPISSQKILKCENGHLIHRKCLEKHLKIAPNNPTCPTCGIPFSSEILQTFPQKIMPSNSATTHSPQEYEHLMKEISDLGKKLVEVKKREKLIDQEYRQTLARKRDLENELQVIQGKQVTLESQMEQIQLEIKAYNRQIEELEAFIPGGKKISETSSISASVEKDIIQSQKIRSDTQQNLMSTSESSISKSMTLRKHSSSSEENFNFLSALSEKITQNSNSTKLEGNTSNDIFDPGLDEDYDPLNFAQTVTRRAKRQQHSESTESPLAFQELTEKRLQKTPGKIARPSFIKEGDNVVKTEHPTARNSSSTYQKAITPSFPKPTPTVRQPPKPKAIPVPPIVKQAAVQSKPISKSVIAPLSQKKISVSTKRTVVSSEAKSTTSINQAVDSNKGGPLCVICHAPIVSKNGQGITQNNGKKEGELVQCPNEHPVHRGCLKLWIVHSDLCPVCHEGYDPAVIDSFNEFKQEYADQKLALKEQEEMEKAQREREELMKKINPEFTRHYNEADKLMKAGHYEEALNVFWDILDKKYFLEKDQRILRTILNLGLIYYKLGKHAHAIKQFMKIVKIDYNYPLAFYFLGLCYDQLGADDKTKWAFERALRNTQMLVEDNPKYKKFVTEIEQRLQKFKS